MTQLFIYICVNNNERIREIIPELISHRFIDTLIFIRTLVVHFRVNYSFYALSLRAAILNIILSLACVTNERSKLYNWCNKVISLLSCMHRLQWYAYVFSNHEHKPKTHDKAHIPLFCLQLLGISMPRWFVGFDCTMCTR